MDNKGLYPLDGSTVGRFPSGDSVGDEILNMFDMENRLTLRRIGRRLYCTHTHSPIFEELVLESGVSNADSPKIGVWVRALNHQV